MDGIVITGPRAAGKTALARALERTGLARAPGALTTRPARQDDTGQYSHISGEEFEARWRSGEFGVVAAYAGHRYGVLVAAIESVREAHLVPVLTIAPEAVAGFVGSRPHERWEVVYLDAPDAVLDDRLAQRGGRPSPADRQQRARDRAARPVRAAALPWEPLPDELVTDLLNGAYTGRIRSGDDDGPPADGASVRKATRR
jgi:guanylate kinase